MGSSYVNVTLLDAGVDAVRAIAPRPSFVAVSGSDVVVFAAADDVGAPVVGAELARAMGGTGISVGVHDDDILFWEVHRDGGTIAAGAVPDPAAFFGLGADEMADMVEMGELEGFDDAAAPSAAGSGDAAADLVAALGRGDLDAVRAALADERTFATDRHAALAAALGLPATAVGWGYRYIEAEGADADATPAVDHLAG